MSEQPKTVLPKMQTYGGTDGQPLRCGPCGFELDENGDCINTARYCHQSYEIRTMLRLTIAIEWLREFQTDKLLETKE